MVPVEEEEVAKEAEAQLQAHLEVEASVEEAVAVLEEPVAALEEAALEATILDSKIETTKVAKMVMKSQKNLKNQIITTVEV